jgi:uncharacterized protein (DUF1697 family)
VGRTVKTYVALLRGINVGGRTKVSMADLRALFDALGAEDVKTYIQSGNVVFRSRDSGAALSKAIEKRINSDLELNVTVLLRTKAELEKVLAGNPFVGGGRDVSKLYVTFLAEKPDRTRVAGLAPKNAGSDEFRVVGHEIFLHYPNGYGRTKLSNTYFEKQLGVRATTRNWRTITKLVELAGA